MYGSSFDKFYVIIACCEDIYGYCIQRSNNDHFHPLLEVKSCLFSVVYNKQTQPRFLVLADFICR